MALGGYRKGSGRSKSGYYNGIYCGSTYELCWLIHALDNNVKFIRFEGMLSDGVTKYIPDFILTDSNTIVELKGYEPQESVDKKTRLAESLGYTVVVLRKNNLQHIFDYVANKFGTKQFHTLYDGYKPKYEYKCSKCLKVIQRDAKAKTSLVFCSRRCSGLYNKSTQIRTKKDKTLNEKAKRLYYKNRDKVLARRRELYKLKHN
jgi:hypothetical protein